MRRLCLPRRCPAASGPEQNGCRSPAHCTCWASASTPARSRLASAFRLATQKQGCRFIEKRLGKLRVAINAINDGLPEVAGQGHKTRPSRGRNDIQNVGVPPVTDRQPTDGGAVPRGRDRYLMAGHGSKGRFPEGLHFLVQRSAARPAIRLPLHGRRSADPWRSVWEPNAGRPDDCYMEWRPITLPSVSSTRAMKPYSPMAIFPWRTLPPLAAARAASIAQSAHEK